MKKAKMLNAKKTAITSMAMFVFIVILIFFGMQNTALLTLPEKENSNQKTNKNQSKEVPNQVQSNQEIFSLPDKQAIQQTASLSFEIIKPTKLQARLVNGSLKLCPKKGILEFEIKNTGKFKAEKLFTETQNLQITECINCNIKEIQAGQTVTISMQACIEKRNAFIQFYAINAEKITMQLK